MRITRNHTLGKEEAIARLNRFIENLHTLPLPSGVEIDNVSTEWEHEWLHLSFRARKGIFGTTITGKIFVDDHTVTLESDLPPIVTTFIPEERIVDALSEKLDEFFAPA